LLFVNLGLLLCDYYYYYIIFEYFILEILVIALRL
jgi:hypothetical protein